MWDEKVPELEPHRGKERKRECYINEDTYSSLLLQKYCKHQDPDI
jgi:hypothetical protein